jgi:hypothetical protein
VIPSAGSMITNTALVGTMGYDLDMVDNYCEQQTLVDSQPPSVNWEEPVVNREIYTTSGGEIKLKVSAEDNDQVQRVDFYRYEGSTQIYIDSVYTPPFQFVFNVDVLPPYQFIPIEAFAFDRAGNRNLVQPETYRQIIYIIRAVFIPHFLPAIIK